MKHLEDIMRFFESEKHIIGDERKIIYGKLKEKFKDFLTNLKEEKEETKQAFELLVQATFDNKELTKEQKEEIGDQLKDVLKAIGLIGLAALPGGSLFFILTKFLKVNKYILPTALLDK